jgi:hypothetical protein
MAPDSRALRSSARARSFDRKTPVARPARRKRGLQIDLARRVIHRTAGQEKGFGGMEARRSKRFVRSQGLSDRAEVSWPMPSRQPHDHPAGVLQ